MCGRNITPPAPGGDAAASAISVLPVERAPLAAVASVPASCRRYHSSISPATLPPQTACMSRATWACTVMPARRSSSLEHRLGRWR